MPSRICTAGFLLFAGLSLWPACGADRPSLVLKVDPVPSGAKQVEVQLTLNGSPLPTTPFAGGLPVGPMQMGFLLPTDANGDLEITVHVKGPTTCDIAKGSTLAELVPHGRLDVSLQLTTLRPAPPITQTLTAVWGAAKADFWVGATNGAMYRGDGTCWYDYTDVSNVGISAFSGTSTSDVWAVGNSRLILHFTGDTWQQVVNSVLPPDNLFGVLAFRKNLAIALGGNGSYAYHMWDGVSWNDIRPELGSLHQGKLFDLWGTSEKDLFLAAEAGSGTGMGGLGIIRRQAGVWSKPTAGQVDSISRSCVWGSSLDNVWFGSSSAMSISKGALLVNFDGTKYQQIQLPGTVPGDAVNDIWGSSADDMWVALQTTNSPKLFRKTGPGTTFTPVSLPMVPSTVSLIDIWGTGPNDVWVVGTAGTRLHYDGSSFTLSQ